jgi:N-acetylmuramoyl-L-alanine amidase
MLEIDHQHRGLRNNGPFGRPPYDVRGVTLHYTGGGLGVRGVIDTLLRRRLAYHYVVTRDGVAHKLVEPTHRVSHAGGGRLPIPEGGYANRNTVALSFDNAGYEQWPQLRREVPIWSVHPDPRSGRLRRWQPYTDAQLDTAADVVAGVLRTHGLDSSRIYTHQQFASTKTDPGPAFPLARFKRMVGARLGERPLLDALVPRIADVPTLTAATLLGAVTAMAGTVVLTRLERLISRR